MFTDFIEEKLKTVIESIQSWLEMIWIIIIASAIGGGFLLSLFSPLIIFIFILFSIG